MAAGTGTARTGTGEPRPEKVAVVTEVRERLSSSNGALLTEYRGLKVADLARLRHSLRESGGEYGIYKNTLVRRAAVDLGLDDMVDLLVGPTAIAFVTGDPVAVAKSLRDFAKTSPNLVVKGGLLGKKVLSAAEATALADVAPREVVLAQLAGALAAPLVKMAGLLQALPRNFAYGLKALLDLKAADEPAPAPADEAPAPAPAAATETAEPESAPAEAAATETATPDTTDIEAAPTDEPGPVEPDTAPVEPDTAPVDSAPADEPAPTDTAPADSAPADEPAPTEASATEMTEAETEAPAAEASADAPDAPDTDSPGADASVDDTTTDIDTTTTAPEATDTEETQES
jgi:large subunit ribosomal protein L10